MDKDFSNDLLTTKGVTPWIDTLYYLPLGWYALYEKDLGKVFSEIDDLNPTPKEILFAMHNPVVSIGRGSSYNILNEPAKSLKILFRYLSGKVAEPIEREKISKLSALSEDVIKDKVTAVVELFKKVESESENTIDKNIEKFQDKIMTLELDNKKGVRIYDFLVDSYVSFALKGTDPYVTAVKDDEGNFKKDAAGSQEYYHKEIDGYPFIPDMDESSYKRVIQNFARVTAVV